MMKTTLTLLSFLVSASFVPLAAQTDGPLVGTPSVVIVKPGTVGPGGALGPETLHRKAAGFMPYAPNGPSPGLFDPVYTMTAMFGGGLAPPPFEINAFSTGLDCVMASPPVGGVSLTLVPPGAWGAILFSVTPSTPGDPGGLIESAAAEADGAAADFFTLMVPGSFLPPSVDPCYPQDRPQRALDSVDMGLFTPFAPGDVSALDIYVPLYHAALPPVPAFLPTSPTVYFSVSNDAITPQGGGASLVPGAWFAGSPPSAATILKTKWMPTVGIWTPPVPHLTFVDLGLDIGDDVDALAVDELKCLLMFSIVKTPTSSIGEQMQIASWTKSNFGDMGVSTGIYSTPSSGGGGIEPVAERARSGDGDVDGTCLIDPAGEQHQGGGGVGVHFAYGAPALAITNEKTLGAGLYRDDAMFGPTLTPTVWGVPTGRTLPAQRLELYAALPIPMGPYVILPPLYIEPLTGVNPLPHRTLPLVVPAIGALIGANVDFFWVIRGDFPRPSSPVLRIAI